MAFWPSKSAKQGSEVNQPVMAQSCLPEKALPIRSGLLGGRRARKVVGVVAAGATGLATVAFTAPTVAAATVRAEAPLQQGLAFYKGKSITLLAPTETGSGYDAESRAIAPLMAKYLDATINVEDFGNSIAGADTLAKSSPNGLTFGFVAPSASLIADALKIQYYNFDPSDLPFLGGPVNTPQMIMGYQKSSYSSFAQLRKATAAKPAKWLTVDVPGGNVTYQFFAEAFGLHVHFINGYNGQPAQLEGLLRGDGDVTSIGEDLGGPAVKAGQVHPIEIQSVPDRAETANYQALKNVPTLEELSKQYPPRTQAAKKALKLLEEFNAIPGFEFVTQPDVPAADVDALRAAMRYAMTSKTLDAAFVKLDDTLGFVSGPTAQAAFGKAGSLVKAVQQAAG